MSRQYLIIVRRGEDALYAQLDGALAGGVDHRHLGPAPP
jgi:hypothetical protein